MSWKSRRKKAEKGFIGTDNPLTKHHRCPKSLNGSDKPSNISMLPKSQHEAWHTIAGSLNPSQIADIINKYYLDPNYAFVVVRRNDLDE